MMREPLVGTRLCTSRTSCLLRLLLCFAVWEQTVARIVCSDEVEAPYLSSVGGNWGVRIAVLSSSVQT